MEPSITQYRAVAEREEYRPQTKTFFDPALDEEGRPPWQVTLTVRPMHGQMRLDYLVQRVELVDRHVTGLVDGNGDLVKKDGEVVRPPEPIFVPNLGNVLPDRQLCVVYAKLATMWAGAGPCLPFSEVIAWAELSDTAYAEIVHWINEIDARPEEAREERLKAAREGRAAAQASSKNGAQEGNSSGAPTRTTSDERSGTTTTTPSSPNDSTPTSAPPNEPAGSAPASSESASSSSGGLPPPSEPTYRIDPNYMEHSRRVHFVKDPDLLDEARELERQSLDRGPGDREAVSTPPD